MMIYQSLINFGLYTTTEVGGISVCSPQYVSDSIPILKTISFLGLRTLLNLNSFRSYFFFGR